MARLKELNYSKLRKHHQELGVPWTDHTFPANDSSIGIQKVDTSNLTNPTKEFSSLNF